MMTIPVARTRAGVAAGRDEVLERALKSLQLDQDLPGLDRVPGGGPH